MYSIHPPRTSYVKTILTIIAQELRQRRWSILWWILGIGAYVSLNLAVYPTFRNQAAQLDAALQHIPNTARALITDTGSFITPVGYLSSKVYYFILPLLFSFLTIALGSSLMGREEQQRTIELVLARPVSRGAFLIGKAISGLIVLLLVSVAVAILTAIEARLFGFTGIHSVSVLSATLMAALLALVFGAIAFMLTAAGRTGRGASIGIAVLLALGGYVISSLDQTIHWLRTPAKLLPFHYYHPAELLNGVFSAPETIGFAAVVCILTLLAWLAFRRRDIN